VAVACGAAVFGLGVDGGRVGKDYQPRRYVGGRQSGGSPFGLSAGCFKEDRGILPAGARGLPSGRYLVVRVVYHQRSAAQRASPLLHGRLRRAPSRRGAHTRVPRRLVGLLRDIYESQLYARRLAERKPHLVYAGAGARVGVAHRRPHRVGLLRTPLPAPPEAVTGQ